MADWMACPGCQLRHTRRPDGLCPRCKQPVDAAAAPTTEAAPIPMTAPSSPPARPERAPVALGAPTSPSAARLGNLAQAARGKELKNARGIMLFIGVISILANGYFFTAAASNVQEELDKELGKLGPTFVVDPVKLAQVRSQAVRTTRLIAFGGMLLGGIFVACGLLVERHPVPITVTALALYLGGNAIFGMLNPASLGAGLIMKIFIVVALFKAVQAAIAYQKELAATAEAA
jgi:hypothetical protein